jgi:hypothetical protein
MDRLCLKISGAINVCGPVDSTCLGFALIAAPLALQIFVGILPMFAQHSSDPSDWFGFDFDAACHGLRSSPAFSYGG